MVSTLRSSYYSALEQVKGASFPADTVFAKLTEANPELPYTILDEAFAIQNERRNPPLLREEFEKAYKSSWKITLRHRLEQMGFGFFFRQKTSDSAPKDHVSPQRIARNIHNTRPVRLTKPAAPSIEKETRDGLLIDMDYIGDDMRHAINRYAKEHPVFDFDSYEQKTLRL